MNREKLFVSSVSLHEEIYIVELYIYTHGAGILSKTFGKTPLET